MVVHLAQISQLPLLSSLLSSWHIQPNLQTRSCQPFPPNLSPVSLCTPLEHPPFPASYFRYWLPAQTKFCLQQMVESLFSFVFVLFYHLGANYPAQPSHKNKDDFLLFLFLTKAPVTFGGTWTPGHRSSKATRGTQCLHRQHFPPICRRYSQFLKPAGDTRLPMLTSVLRHIRFLPITIPLRSAGLDQPADFARTGLTCSIPQEVITRKRNLEENQKKIISWHSNLSCYQCILHFTSSPT